MARAPKDTSTVEEREVETRRRATFEHYADPWLYDHEYRRRRADVNWYRARARSLGGDVLELGCGSGRVLVPLVRDGLHVVGVDASQPMLVRCQERLARLAPSARDRARLVRADFRALPFARRWPVIICPFNAMMHLYSRDDLSRFFDGVRDRLAPGGRFVFDILNPDLKWLNRDPHRRWARTRFKDPRSGASWIYTTNHFYDAATQIAWIRIFYDALDAPSEKLPRTRVVRLAHRQIFPEELLLLLDNAGFTVEERLGDFDGSAFTGDSESQVCTCSIRD